MESNMKNVLRSYMNKCGEGRGLEKFLRRNSFSSGDERETSASITTSKSRNKTKSLESLNESKKEETKVKSPKTPPAKEKEAAEVIKPMEAAKVVVKQSSEKHDKKKSFNYESIIEITLPQQQQLQIAYPVDQLKDKSDEKIEEPIRPIIHTPKQSKMINSDKKLSPSSCNDNESFVSNKQKDPMEWDSFIPGYETETYLTTNKNNNNNMQLCNAMELDDNELSALKTYFHQRGLQLPNENLIVVIKNRQEKVTEKQFENIRKNKEKWQNIYEKYKEKYQQSSTMSFHCPDAQSTPKITEQPSTSKISEVVPKIAMEKGSQTSLVKNAVKSIQTSSLPRDETLKNTVECSKTQDQFEIYHNPSEVAESFEFVRGSRVKENKKSSTETSSKESKESKQNSTSAISEAGSSKNSDLSESIKNVNVTNFDDSLKVAIALLNSLLESSMRPELKRNLAEKVIQKIVHMQTSRSIQTSTIDSSVYPRSNSSAAQSAKSKDDKPERPHKNREEVLRDCFQPMTKSEMSRQNSQHEDSSKGTLSIPKSQLVDYMKREKHSQVKWIEKEIEHLNNLRDFLKRNETPMPLENPIYENTNAIKKKEKPLPEVPVDTNVWNSHGNMKKVKNRSKLETPNEESLASFIDTRNKIFMEKYNKQQKQLQDEEANAYTQPYSSGSRKVKNPPTVKHSKSAATRKSTANKDVQTSTSLASSSVFESSDSMSVPVNTNSKTTTTHYEAQAFESTETREKIERKQKVAVTQTTDSICRTKPIYEVRNDNNEKYGTTSTTTITRRVKKLQNDKQMQTKPPSVKYTLTFDKKNNKPNVHQYASLPQRSEYATITKSSKDIYNQMSYASLNYREYVENKENYDNDVLIDNNNAEQEEEEDIDLQKCLNSNRPDIFTRFEKRKKCIEELKKLRALRNEHRSKLLLLTSDKSLEGKLFSSLPDLPLKKTRMFSTKALKLQTKRVMRNLDEVKQKKKEENLKNLKRKTRLMTEIFNKNLQKNVLKGNLNHSNTVNLITK